MSLIVQKFGGSSVRDHEHLLRMARIVKSRVDEGDDVVVVLSAQGDTTDGLLQKAKEISERPSPRELDMLLSAGEQMSAALSGGEAKTTNNRMELTAVIRALSLLKEPCIVELWSDSKYVIDGLSKGWAKGWKAKGWVKSDKKPALNPDLWDELLRLESIHTLRYHWVKGHAENEFNNRCDELAVAESRKFR